MRITVKKFIKIKIALMLFKNNKFSIEQASDFSNLSLYDFMDECKKQQILVISYDDGELENEMKLMNKIEYSQQEKSKNKFSLFSGIWKDRDITQKSIRKQAWNISIK